MTNSKFLKEAKAFYKSEMEKVTNGKDWKAEMNFLHGGLILRVWFDGEKREFMHRWCTVQSLPAQIEENTEKLIIRKAGQILSGSNDEEISMQVKILRKALKEQPDQTADYVDGITMWENVEYSFTVKAACEYIGIE